jgi:hypothetical protein
MSLSWASSIQFVSPPPTSLRSFFILSFHLRLGLPSGLFPSGFPTNACIRLTYWFPINIISPVHHTHFLFFYHRWFIVLSTDSVVKYDIIQSHEVRCWGIIQKFRSCLQWVLYTVMWLALWKQWTSLV